MLLAKGVAEEDMSGVLTAMWESEHMRSEHGEDGGAQVVAVLPSPPLPRGWTRRACTCVSMCTRAHYCL